MSATSNPSSLAAASEPATPASVPLEQVFDALRKRVPAAQQGQAETFTKAFYRRMTVEEFSLHSADAWAVLAADFLDLARARKPGEAQVRVFNASLKQHGLE